MHHSAWLYRRVSVDRHLLSVRARRPSSPYTLQLEIYDGQGFAPTYAAWRLSGSRSVLAIVIAGSA
jgi:hypothetical protein